MIEIIHEEDFERTERKELPKDIKQIGKPDIGERIYMENQVYEFLHPYDSISEKKAYILLGSFENYAGRQCTFVEAAIGLEEIAFDGELPLWNDQTWAYVYRQLRQEHDSMVIVGWAMDIKGWLPNLTVRLETLHQNNFGGAHQILFLMDSLEGEEIFYGSRNGHLYRREGFYIYYDKGISAKINQREEKGRQKEVIKQEEETGQGRETKQEEKNSSEEAWEEAASQRRTPRQGNYRKQILEREEKRQSPAYASSFLLLVVVCAFGITAYVNYQKMNAMQETLAQMSGGQIKETQVQETEQEEAGIFVESVEGNVMKEDNAAIADGEDTTVAQTPTPEIPPNTQTAPLPDAPTVPPQDAQTVPLQDAPTAPAQGTQAESTQTLTEAQTYLAQGYYVVQKGDSLVGICKKIYQTTAVMDKLCEVNEIADENEIYAGQKLTLPN